MGGKQLAVAWHQAASALGLEGSPPPHEKCSAGDESMDSPHLTMGALIAAKNQRLKRVVRPTDTSETPLVEHWSFDQVCALIALTFVRCAFGVGLLKSAFVISDSGGSHVFQRGRVGRPEGGLAQTRSFRSPFQRPCNVVPRS